MLKKMQAFYPIYFAAFPLLAFYLGNKREVQWSAMVIPLLFLLASFLILWFFVKMIVKNHHQTNLIVLVLLLYFFSYGYLTQKIPLFNWHYAGFLIYTCFFVLIFFVLRHWRKRPELAIFFTIVGIYVVGFSLINIVAYEIQRRTVTFSNDDVFKTVLTPVKKNNSPDIYYIILDRYANSRILERQYGFDNKDFLDFLRQKGFYLAEQAAANYPKTHLSLASSLNLDYLDEFAKKVGSENSDYTPAFKLVENNKVAQFLKLSGYRYFYFGDWWGPTTVSKLADRNFNLYANSNEFSRKFLQTTILTQILGSYYKGNRWFGFFQDRIYENTNYKFAQIEQIAKVKGPKFVFAHMLFPHYPYIFNRQCQRVDDQRKASEEAKYLEQLQCVNIKIKKALTVILKNSKSPPIIILQSDEGPFQTEEMNRDGEKIDWTQVSDQAVERHMAILNAYFLPGVDLTKLSPTITPVNTFRLIFNHYFDAKLPLLPEKSYFIPALDRPYQYIEITEKLKNL